MPHISTKAPRTRTRAATPTGLRVFKVNPTLISENRIIDHTERLNNDDRAAILRFFHSSTKTAPALPAESRWCRFCLDNVTHEHCA